MDTEELAHRVETILTAVERNGLAALAPLLAPDAAEPLRAVGTQLGPDFRPAYRLDRGSVEAVAGGFRFRVRRQFVGSVFLLRDRAGTWTADRRSTAGAARSSHIVAGAPEGVTTLPQFAEFITSPAGRRLHVLLGRAENRVPFSVYCGFAASGARLEDARVLSCRTTLENGAGGEVTVEGRDPPVEVMFGPDGRSITALERRPPAAFFRLWLRGR